MVRNTRKNKKQNSKGFLATTILLISITMIYHAAITQNTIQQKTQETINTVKLHQETQENRYRLTQGFRDSVKQSMHKTEGQKPIVREQKACKQIEKWLNQLKKEKKYTKIKIRSGYVDKNTYQLQEALTRMINAFEPVRSKLKKQPRKTLKKLNSEPTLCVNYISIQEEEPKARIKHNNYLVEQATSIIDKEPTFKIQANTGKTKQNILIPGKTTIQTKENQ